VKSKAAVLFGLLVLLIGLVVVYFVGPNQVDKVTIVEKYYPQESDGTAVGFKTEKAVEVSKTETGYNCAMEFDNDKIFELDCKRYVNYNIGETVYIQTDGNQITEIRRKK
jgi:hypothetical protein